MASSLIQDGSRRPTSRAAGNAAATQRGLTQTRRQARVATPDDVDEDVSSSEERETGIAVDAEPDGKANKKGLAVEVHAL